MSKANNVSSRNCEDRFHLALQSNVDQVNRAVQFLSSPEIRVITADSTKAKFLKSRGLSDNEITEAFVHHYATQEPSSSRLQLCPVANEHSSDGTVAVVNTHSSSALSKFFNFCQKLVLFAGIASSFYYAYQKWARARDAKKKTEKIMKDEINHLRNEITKISNELRNYQLLERNNANLQKEVNSLKAILVGRQHFEEKQIGKVALPSWQLNGVGPSKMEAAVASSSKPNETTLSTNGPTSCQIKEKVESTPVCAKSEDTIPVVVSLPSEDESSHKNTSSSNRSENLPEIQQQPLKNSTEIKDAKRNSQKSAVVENGYKLKKSNEKKN